MDHESGFFYSLDFDNDGAFEIVNARATTAQGPDGIVYVAVLPASFLKSQNGDHPIIGRIEDKDGGTSQFTTTVTVTNLPPVIQSIVVPENITAGTPALFTATASDPGNDPLQFEWEFGGATQIGTPASHTFPASGTQPVKLTVRDSEGASVSQTVNVPVQSANLPPVLSLAETEIDENTPGGTIGTLTATDAEDHAISSWTVDDNRFEIVGTTFKLKSAETLDHESEETVTVKVTAVDSGTPPAVTSTSFVIDVIDLNEVPTDVSLSSSNVPEEQSGATIGTVVVSDQDENDPHVVTVDDARFEVVDNTLRLKEGLNLDHEAKAQIPIQITAQDSGSPALSLTKAFLISVEDLNEPPADIQLSNHSFIAQPGAVIGTLTAADPDEGDQVNWSVDDSRFEVIDSTLKLKEQVTIDALAEPDVDINVTANDSGTPTQSTTQKLSLRALSSGPAWQNPRDALDVNDDGNVSPADILVVVNYLNNNGAGVLPLVSPAATPPPFLDVNGDNNASPADALLVTNALNEGAAGEPDADALEQPTGDTQITLVLSQPMQPSTQPLATKTIQSEGTLPLAPFVGPLLDSNRPSNTPRNALVAEDWRSLDDILDSIADDIDEALTDLTAADELFQELP